MILSSIKQHAPLKPLSRKQKCLKNNTWITKGIPISIRKRYAIFKLHFLFGETQKNLTVENKIFQQTD